MFGIGEKREYVFIFTTLDKLHEELIKEEYRKKNLIVGLSNNDFRIAVLDLKVPDENSSKEAEIEGQLQYLVQGYDPMDYITRTLTESKNEYGERVIAVSIEREKIDEIVTLSKEMRVRLKGIYPSFILDEQENLSDVLAQIPSINVGESVVDASEVEESHLKEAEESDKVHLLLTENGEPLNMRKQISDEVETEYNFLEADRESEIQSSRVFSRCVKIFWVLFILQLIGYGILKFNGHMKNNKITETAAANQQTENRLKELESKIAGIPNFEMKLKKLEAIMKSKHPGANEVLFAVRKSLAEGVYLDNIQLDGDKISLTGTSESPDGVYEFQRNLLKEGFFGITSSPLNNAGRFYTFKIEAKIK